jgi:colicin import membrane protein
MKPGITISCVGHAGVLLWSMIAFAARPMDAPPVEALPVDFISATQFSEMTAGVKNAPKAAAAKPLADKVDVPKPIQQLAPKVVDKPEVVTPTAAEKPPPLPEPKPPEKPQKKPPDPKPPEKEAEKKPQPETKVDQIAQELKKEEAKKPTKPAEKPAPKKPPQQAPKFDSNQIAALLDKREPQRQVATAETLNPTPNLGTSNGTAAHLSQSEIDALRAKLISLWNPPQAISVTPDKYIVTIRIRLNRDHKLAGPPAVLTSGTGPLFEATRDSAVRAVFQAQPYDMLSQATYEQWKEMDINFNPREVFGG